MRVIPLLAAAIVTAEALAQPSPTRPLPRGTSAIRGSVRDDVSNEPIAGCTVRASTVIGNPSPANTRRNAVVTGPDGLFEFAGITDGNYFMMVECGSHLTTCFPISDSTGPPCSSLTVFKDQQRSNVDIKLTRGATLRGRVVDHAGKPVAKAEVRVGASFLADLVLIIRGATTKEDGSFELDRLPAAELALEVDAPQQPGALRSPLVYYPGVLKRDEAGRVEVIAGKVTEGVVITIPPTLDRSLTVRIPPPDATMTDVSVSLIRHEPLMTRRLDIDAEGHATIKGLIAGRYVVMATAVSGQDLWADFQAVDFSEESLDIPLQLRPSGRIRGRIVADGGGVPPLDSATISAVWVDNDTLLNPLTPEEGAVAIDGTFEIRGLFGRRVLQLGRFNPDWRIHAVMQGRSDVTETGVDVASSHTTDVTIIVRPR
jgi:Carboxypeptidase regulatory-like domain